MNITDRDLIPVSVAAASLGITEKRLVGFTVRELKQVYRIARRVSIKRPDECWPWIGVCNISLGYGRVRWMGRDTTAHRAVFEVVNGPIPDGLHVCHSCDNPACVNPSHLWLGTRKDNMRDMVAKGRQGFYERTADHLSAMSARARRYRLENPGYQDGEKGPNTKLTTDQVLAIRSGAESQTKTARKYGVSQWTICAIRNRVTWKHLP